MKAMLSRGALGTAMVAVLATLVICFVVSAATPQPVPQSLVVFPGKGRTQAPLNVVGEKVLVKMAGADTNDKVAFFHLTVPSMSGPPLHQHTREDEIFYVLDGYLWFQIDDKRTLATAGTTVFAPRLTVHAYQNFTHSNAHLLIWASPAGLDRLFEEISAAAHGKAVPDRATLVRLNEKYGVKIMGPPLSPFSK